MNVLTQVLAPHAPKVPVEFAGLGRQFCRDVKHEAPATWEPLAATRTPGSIGSVACSVIGPLGARLKFRNFTFAGLPTDRTARPTARFDRSASMDSNSTVRCASLSGLVAVGTSPSQRTARHTATFTRLATLLTYSPKNAFGARGLQIARLGVEPRRPPAARGAYG